MIVLVHVHVTKHVVALYGVAVVGILEGIALLQHVDGAMLATAFATIGTLVGYAFGRAPVAATHAS